MLASIMELLALQAFSRAGRAPQTGAADEMSIRTRAKGASLPPVFPTQTCDDAVSSQLFTISEMQQAFNLMGGWWENMRETLTIWTDEVLRLIATVKAEQGRSVV